MLSLINLFLIGAVLIAALFVYAVREARKYGTGVREEAAGICASAIETASQKEARKQEVLFILRQNGKASNTELREKLGVSSRTIVRYMDELERADIAEQIGDTGRGAAYRLKQ